MDDEKYGFQKMSAAADSPVSDAGISGRIAEGARNTVSEMSGKLKSVGIDADGAIELAGDKAADLQDMLMKEIRQRPLRALGWAAAAGFVLGIMSAR